jgi:hypothetical protein
VRDAVYFATFWQNDRMPRLNEIHFQCAQTLTPVPPPRLADENLRAYIMLLSAHFQGFCRDLHTECVVAVAASLPVGLQLMFQTQCLAGRDLDGGNPRFEAIRNDFERFYLGLNRALSFNVANATHVTHIGQLNSWRNYAAHQKTSPPAGAGSLSLAAVQAWKNSCDSLATELDGILYNRQLNMLGNAPW